MGNGECGECGECGSHVEHFLVQLPFSKRLYNSNSKSKYHVCYSFFSYDFIFAVSLFLLRKILINPLYGSLSFPDPLLPSPSLSLSFSLFPTTSSPFCLCLSISLPLPPPSLPLSRYWSPSRCWIILFSFLFPFAVSALPSRKLLSTTWMELSTYAGEQANSYWCSYCWPCGMAYESHQENFSAGHRCNAVMSMAHRIQNMLRRYSDVNPL